MVGSLVHNSPKFLTPAHEKANRLLGVVSAARKDQGQAEAALAGELERLKASSPLWTALEGDLLFYKMRLDLAEKELKKFEEEHQADLFGDLEAARIQLPSGALIYSLTHPVIRTKGRPAQEVMAEIEDYALLEMYGLGDYHGFLEVLKIAKSLDFDRLDKWPDERLVLVGLNRRKVESFTFEVREET